MGWLEPRRCAFPQHSNAHAQNTRGFHQPQYPHSIAPIPPIPFEEIDGRRETRKAAQREARRRKAEVRAAAHATRTFRVRAARASRRADAAGWAAVAAVRAAVA